MNNKTSFVSIGLTVPKGIEEVFYGIFGYYY